MKTVGFSMILMILLVFAGCSKNNPDARGSGGAGGTEGSFDFANTEYTGTAHTVGWEYPQPICIHFFADSTVSAYALFSFYDNAVRMNYDTLHGKITSVTSDGNAGEAISVTFKESDDQQVMTISADRSGLTGGSLSTTHAGGGAQFNYQALGLCKTVPALRNTNWNTDSVLHFGSYVGQAYPDVAGLDFNDDSTTSYFRNGQVWQSGIAGGTFTILKLGYLHIGARVYVYGWNENFLKAIPYFCVLSPDGRSMYVDARDFTVARLPTYIQTSDYYGPAGETPKIHRMNLP